MTNGATAATPAATGQAVLNTPSSAGCIRLPAGIEATIFDHLPRGTEVRIEKSLDAGPEVVATQG